MRKLLIALTASVCFVVFSSAASATSVNLVWTAAAGGTIDPVSGNSVAVSSTAAATLTLDIQMEIDSLGLAGAFLRLDFDTDLGNEVNILSWEEISWAKTNSKGITTRTLAPLAAGIQSTQESTGAQGGYVFEFDGTSLTTGPSSTTLTFARLVFSTNFANVMTDGDDIFTSGIMGCNSPSCDITDTVTFGGASVNLVPEPSTLSLLVLSFGGLLLAGRRGRK